MINRFSEQKFKETILGGYGVKTNIPKANNLLRRNNNTQSLIGLFLILSIFWTITIGSFALFVLTIGTPDIIDGIVHWLMK